MQILSPSLFRSRRTIAFSACYGLLFAPLAMAQSTFATVQGTVLDSSGAAIPGATVTVVDDNTGKKDTVRAGSGGEYRVVDLNSGSYTITASQPGFGDQTFPHQTILARQVLKLDARLSAGTVATEIDVSTAALTSDTETVSHSLSSSDINNLALNFRASDNTSPLYVSTLTAGVQTDPSGNISVAGGFPYTTSYSIDGVSTVNARYNGPSANLFPSVEAISEFKVNTANNDAEFGQPSDITVTTKSGTNTFHGAIYEFFANRDLNASNGVTGIKGPLTANDFGGYIGGPLSVPHFYNSRGKTFFFGDYEGTRRPESGSIAIAVPTPAELNGDFSALLASKNPVQLYHPFSAVPYVNNQIPVNQSAIALLKALYPTQNVPGNVNNYQSAFPGVYTLNNGDGRIDENITDKHHVWVRFGGKNVLQTGTDGSTTYNPTNGTYASRQRLRNLVASYSYTNPSE